MKMIQKQVTKEAVDKVILKIFDNNPNKEEINLEKLLKSLVEEFESDLTHEQKDKLGEFIFFNPDVLKQLEESENEPEGNDISSFDEYLKFKQEVINERK
jgi:hypothetical protein